MKNFGSCQNTVTVDSIDSRKVLRSNSDFPTVKRFNLAVPEKKNKTRLNIASPDFHIPSQKKNGFQEYHLARPACIGKIYRLLLFSSPFTGRAGGDWFSPIALHENHHMTSPTKKTPPAVLES